MSRIDRARRAFPFVGPIHVAYSPDAFCPGPSSDRARGLPGAETREASGGGMENGRGRRGLGLRLPK